MRGAGIDLQGRALDQLRRQEGRGADGHDLVVVAMRDQGRDVEPLEVLGEVCLGKGLDAVVCPLQPDLHAPEPERVANALGHRRAWPVGTVEGLAQILVELGAIGGNAGADGVEGVDRQTAGIDLRLQHQRWDSAQEHCLGQAGGAVATDVPGHLAATGGVADENRVFQIERFDELREVVRIGVHLVTGPGLARTAMPPTVMRDGAKTVGRHEDRLVVPGVGIERPAMAEHDRLPAAPVLVEDRGAVIRGDRAHRGSPHIAVISPWRAARGEPPKRGAVLLPRRTARWSRPCAPLPAGADRPGLERHESTLPRSSTCRYRPSRSPRVTAPWTNGPSRHCCALRHRTAVTSRIAGLRKEARSVVLLWPMLTTRAFCGPCLAKDRL